MSLLTMNRTDFIITHACLHGDEVLMMAWSKTNMANKVTRQVVTVASVDDNPSTPRGTSAVSCVAGPSFGKGVTTAHRQVSRVSAWQGREAGPSGCGTISIGAGTWTAT